MTKSLVGLNSGIMKAGDAIRSLKKKRKVLEYIPLEKIAYDPEQYRQDISHYKLNELAENIKALGLIQHPLLEVTDKGYSVVAGEMRTRAYNILRLRYPDEPEWETLPCFVIKIEPIDGFDVKTVRKLIQSSENNMRDEGTLFDRARNYLKIYELGGNEAMKVALGVDDLKFTDSELSKWKGVAKTNEAIKERVVSNNITDKETIIVLSKIASHDPKSFESIMGKVEDKSLDKSLKNVAAQTWDKVKSEVGVKPKRVRPSVKKQKKPVKSSNIPNMSEISIVADDIVQSGNQLIITMNKNEIIRVTLPESMKIDIGKASSGG
jgi:hypothetical protein